MYHLASEAGYGVALDNMLICQIVLDEAGIHQSFHLPFPCQTKTNLYIIPSVLIHSEKAMLGY